MCRDVHVLPEETNTRDGFATQRSHARPWGEQQKGQPSLRSRTMHALDSSVSMATSVVASRSTVDIQCVETGCQEHGAVEHASREHSGTFSHASKLPFWLQDFLQNTVTPTLLENLAAAPGATPRVEIVQDPTTAAARTLPTLPPALSPAPPPAMVKLSFLCMMYALHALSSAKT